MRKNEISLLNVLYCLIVIFIHCISSAVVSLPMGSVSHIIVYTCSRMSSFVVQGFIFLSGLKHFLKEDTGSYSRFLLTKLKTIILPYIAWCAIYYIFYSSPNGYQIELGGFVKGVLLGTICYHLYYIVILMQFFLLFPLWKKLFVRENALIVLPVAVLITSICSNGLPGIIQAFFPKITFIYNDRLFTTYLLYWTLGCYAGIFYTEFTRAIKNSKIAISILFAVISFVNVYLCYSAMQGAHSVSVLGSIHILYCICAIVFTYMLALLVRESAVVRSRTFGVVNKSTYSVYLSHCLFLSATDMLIINTVNPQPIASTLIRLAVVYTSSIILCSAYTLAKSAFKARRKPSEVDIATNSVSLESEVQKENTYDNSVS